MLTAKKEKGPKGTVVRVSGVLDETVNLDQLLGPPTEASQINLKELTRINIPGAKAWIKYTQTRGIKITLAEVSVPFVEFSNVIVNFNGPVDIQSCYAPYYCKSCSTDLLALVQSDEVRKSKGNLGPKPCPRCQASAEFDDVPHWYFAFLLKGR